MANGSEEAMKTGYYVAMAEAQTAPVRESPFMGLTDPRVASLRCFRRYSRNAHYDFVDRGGVLRWMTPKMMRIEAILLRVGTVGSGYTTTGAIASEALCSRGYVSKMVTRFEAWGVIGTIRTRGRYGKLFVFARAAGDGLDRFMAEARRRIHQSAVGRAARELKFKVSSVFSTGRGMRKTVYGSNEVLEETFTGFAREVIHERARLALEDPDGEAEAAAPLTQDRAWELYSNTWNNVLSRAGGNHEDLAEALGVGIGKSKGVIRCPAHEDKRSSLSWKISNGKLLLHCFAGCTFDEIRRAVL